MKYVKAIIFIIYLFVYCYSVHKTSAAPNETYWGYICVVCFGYLFVTLVSFVIKLPPKDSEKNPEDTSE
jgi:hypothetical protein